MSPLDPSRPLRILVVGAGFSGAVVARELAEGIDARVEVWDRRMHLAGNCHTERDAGTGVLVHRYGPHFFNTDCEEIWNYVRSFGEFRPVVNRVKAFTPRGLFSLPLNLMTINQFFGKAFSPAEAKAFVASLGDASIIEPANFEEQALKLVGRELYENFFYGYTLKQWGCEPRELPASILKRLPIRFTYEDSYYDNPYVGLPVDGYTRLVENILNHNRIQTFPGREFHPDQVHAYDHCFYTGPLDGFFNFEEGRLGYRTVRFERIEADGDYQGTAVINYTDARVPYTRIHEHKHMTPWESHERTVAFKETSSETTPGDEPYYPKRLRPDKALVERYRQRALDTGRVTFLGRLATYRYLDMDDVIKEARQSARAFIDAFHGGRPAPVFPPGLK